MSTMPEAAVNLEKGSLNESDDSKIQPLVYQRLDASRKEIRLLTLHPPAKEDHALRCTLTPAYLSSHSGSGSDVPEYEALSYVWGEPNFTSPILVNNQELHITPHLLAILTTLRRKETPRTLWIDAICINQADFVERAQQVEIMKAVYSSCKRVLAWVGPTLSLPPPPPPPSPGRPLPLPLQHSVFYEDTVAGMEWLRKTVEQAADVPSMSVEAKKGKVSGPEELLRLMGADADPGQQTARPIATSMSDINILVPLLRDSIYWRRAWVVQEISCAPQVTLVCGETELDWAYISHFLKDEPCLDAFHAMHNLYERDTNHDRNRLRILLSKVKTIEDQRRAVYNPASESHFGLLDVLVRFADKQAADPRDKIYSLLGLVPQNHHIKVDYTKPSDVLYREVSSSLLRMSGNLDLICQNPFELRDGPRALKLAETSQNAPAQYNTVCIPSWVAQLDSPCTHFQSIMFAQRDIFNAGTKSFDGACHFVGSDSRVLKLRGSIIDCVGQIYPTYTYGRIRSSSNAALNRPWLDDTNESTNPPSYEKRYCAFVTLQAIYHKQTISSAMPALANYESFPEQSESRTQAFWRTLVRDCTAAPGMRRLNKKEIEQLQEIHTDRLDSKQGLWTSYTLGTTTDRQRLYVHGSFLPLDEVQESSMLNLYKIHYGDDGYVFACTVHGLFVLTRRYVRAGDIIAVLDGGKLPVVLRRVPKNRNDEFEELYHFVCIAYVHGLMDGEVEEAVARGWLKKRDILLA